MQDPDALLDSLVAVLKDNPTLVAILVDSSKIYAYHHAYPTKVNRYESIQRIKPGEIMVCHTGTDLFHRSNGVTHNFSAYLRPTGSVGVVFLALRDGIITASGQKFKLTQVVGACHPADIQKFGPQSLYVSEQTVIEYHEIQMTLTERGADN